MPKIVLYLVVMGILAGAVLEWKREAVQVCNLTWQKKLDSANATAEQVVAKALLAAREAQVQLESSNATFEQRVQEYESKLKEKRDGIPLSEACQLCRVPAARERLRPGPAPSGGAVETGKPATN